MGAVLKFPKRKTALELNQDELERATVERSHRYRELAEARQRWINADNAVHELQMERQRLLRGDK
jgi:serine protease inhibitor